jgi:hypothetical protein
MLSKMIGKIGKNDRKEGNKKAADRTRYIDILTVHTI